MHAVTMDNQHIPLPATSLVGREDELARLIALLGRPDVRLVTLLGPGGVGKTRLSLQIANDIDEVIVGQVRMVFLANSSEPADVLPAIARALGTVRISDLPPEQEIAQAIGDAPMLLILDNVEQVAADLTFLSDLIQHCPHLTILVTSRVMLRLSVEHVFTLEPLPTHSAGHDQLAPATALFVDRARLVHPNLDLTDDNIRAIDAICQKVDGLPLAIELAAARTRFLSPVAMRDRLTERLAMLIGGPRDVPERHRTLRATLAWSHDLLNTDERVLFRRLGIAINGIPYDAVGPICNSAGDLGDRVEELLDALVDHSLVRIDDHPDTGPRVRLLHTVREFAEEQLELSGEAEAVQRAHAMWYARMVIDTPQSTWGTGRPELRDWTLRHLPDRATFSTVLKRLMDWGETTLAVEMTAQLVGFWNEIGQMREAKEWCDRVMPHILEVPRDAQANLLFKASMVSHVANDIREALDYATQSLHLYEELEVPRSIANAQNVIANLQWQLGNTEEGEQYHRKAIATTQADNNAIGTAMFKGQLADRLIEQGKYDIAEQLLDEAGPIIGRERPDALPLLLGSKAILYLVTNRLDDAGDCLCRSLVFHQPPPHRRPDMLAMLLMVAAELAAKRNMGEEGVQILGKSDEIVRSISLNVSDGSQKDVDRAITALQELVEPDRFDDLWRAGQKMPIPDAIDIAMRVAAVRSGQTSTGILGAPAERDDDLTPREREVLRLLVEGKSNATIADELFISQRTVTTHLTRLYAKLAVTSRTAAISAAMRMGLVSQS